MQRIFETFLLFVSLLGILLAIILFIYSVRFAAFNKFLSGFFFSMNVYGFIYYIVIYSQSVTAIAVFYGSVTPLMYLIGPLAYFYVRSCIRDDATLSKWDLLHFLPALIDLIGIVPYWFEDFAIKKQHAELILDNFSNVLHLRPNWLIPAQLNYIGRPTSWFLYAVLLWMIYLNHIRSLRMTDVGHQYRLVTRWLFLFISMYTLVTVSYFIFNSFYFIPETESSLRKGQLLLIMSEVGFTFLNLALILFPDIFFGLFQKRDLSQQNAAILSDEAEKPVQSNESGSPGYSLDDMYLKEIDVKVKTSVEDQKLFIRPDFSIEQMVNATGMPRHHLYYYFQHFKRKKFTEYRTELRLNYAKMLLESGQASNLTVEAVAQMSGFNSRSTFYQAFKQYFGTAPGEHIGVSGNG